MAPSFAALRSRRQDTRARLDQSYGDSRISAPNEGATWAEWNSPLTLPELEACPSSTSTSPIRREETKASITITINLPWQKKSRSRSSSLPPVDRRQIQLPTSKCTRNISHASPQPSRSNAASPVFSQNAAWSPNQQQHPTRATRTTQDHSSRRPSSPIHSGTPALSLLSPLTESFDEPTTPASAISDFMTSFENSPASPVRHTVADDEFTFLRPRKSPTPQAPGHFREQVLSRSPHVDVRPSPGLSSPRRSPEVAVDHHSTHCSPLLRNSSRRAQSVEPTMQRRRASDEGDRRRYHVSGSYSDADDDNGEAIDQYWNKGSVRRSASRTPQPQDLDYTKSRVQRYGTYDEVIKDYSRIIRAVEADKRSGNSPQPQQGRPVPTKTHTEQVKRVGPQPGSAESGFSFTSDEGYSSGPQTLVPSGEDLWG